MYNLIITSFKGSTITVGITGVPCVITGEVFDGICTASGPYGATGNSGVIGLRLANGNKVYIPADLIAFFY